MEAGGSRCRYWRQLGDVGSRQMVQWLEAAGSRQVVQWLEAAGSRQEVQWLEAAGSRQAVQCLEAAGSRREVQWLEAARVVAVALVVAAAQLVRPAGSRWVLSGVGLGGSRCRCWRQLGDDGSGHRVQ